MSEFHVHGLNDHMVEHQAEHGVKLAQWVAILSALFACFAAIVGYQSSSTENEAIILKNEAIIRTTQASDVWALFQAKKTKIHLMEIAITASAHPEQIQNFKKELIRYTAEEKPIQIKAQELDKEAKAIDQRADQLLHPHEKLAQAMTLLQIAISLASIAALTRKRWLLFFSIGAAAVGGILTIFAWLF